MFSTAAVAKILFSIQFATAVIAQSQIYQQCGGIGWSGATTCVSGAVCTKLNDYYFQCLPGTASSPTASPSPPTSQPPSTTTTPTSTTSAPPSQSTILNISPEWATAYDKATAVVAKLSLNDKVNLGTGVQWMKGACVGNTPAVSSISGFNGLCLEDSPVGVRDADGVSAFPAEINVAATFNRTLMRQRGAAMGAEFKGKGVHVALGPMMNLMRAPASGRNWEGGGGDPFLSGEVAYETIMGIQSQGVQACTKHYINNEQEHFRDSSSSNNVNGTFSCENSQTLNGLLKGQLGFQGYWWATHSTSPAVNAGLDMTMPGDISLGSGTTYFGQTLVNAVQSGQVPQSRIDDMATRILAAWYLLGQDSGFPSTNFNAWNRGGTHVNVQADHKSLIRTIGDASTVLLKNQNGALPLNVAKSIAVIGNGATNSSKGPNGYTDRGGDDGVLAMGWGSGTDDFPYLIAPVDAISARAKADNTAVSISLSDTDLNGAANAAAGKDAALDALVQKVASVNKNTIVVVNSVGPITVEAWIDHPNVTGLVWSGLPGQEAGNAVTDILYGVYNPRWIAANFHILLARASMTIQPQVIYNGNGIVPIPYNEGLLIDYRHFDSANIAPRFEFGFGLSYTTFNYSDLSVNGSTTGGIRQPTNQAGASLDPWLHDKVVSVSFTLTNTGKVAGAEAPQLYLSPPASAKTAPNNLKGFDSVFLSPGQSTTVTFELSRYDFSVWDVVSQSWKIPSGVTGISVGASSRDLRLKGSISN
ncbi:beta-glucosidase [Abortiporus biennis]|nr:beta-glucosidase [Abortiporus biennis]